MTKADIIEALAKKHGFLKKDSYDLVETIFSLFETTLETGEEIKISGFGKFEVRQKDARRAWNPKSGEYVDVDARRVLTFKPSNILRNKLNGKV